MKNLSKFQETTLGEIARKDRYGLVDGPFGSNLPASGYTSSGIPVIRGSNLSLGQERFRARDDVFVSEETANRLSRSLCHPDDIIFTKKGTLGQTGIVPRTEIYKTFLLSSNQMKLSVNTEIADPLFIYYYVSSPISRERILREAMTTGVPKINLEYLRKFSISLPPLPIQRKIAGILSAYDRLIENNTRRIEILEEMARSIYREWFVKFRFPGHEQAQMVDSELGLIPEGWEPVKVEDVVELAYGKSLTAKNRIPGTVPVYGSAGVVGSHNESLVNAPGVIVGRKGNVGSVFWSNDDFFPIDTVFYVQTKVCLHYVYYNLQNQNFINNDAAVPGLNRNQAYSLPFLLPSEKLLKQFQHFVDTIFKQTSKLRIKNDNLRQTRDLLLPRLISGEIDVENLDINTGEIAA